MSVVYTTRFASLAGFMNGTPTPVYTVPDGTRAVVTDIAFSYGINPLPGGAALLGPLDYQVAYLGAAEDSLVGGTFIGSGRWVFEATEVMYVATVGAPLWEVDVAIAGWLLALP